jgi:hypothetical protein
VAAPSPSEHLLKKWPLPLVTAQRAGGVAPFAAAIVRNVVMANSGHCRDLRDV